MSGGLNEDRMARQLAAADALRRAAKLLAANDRDAALEAEDLALLVDDRASGRGDERVVPYVESGREPIYQPEGLRELIFFQLLVDMDLARSDEAWPVPTTPPTGDHDLEFAERVDERLRNVAGHASSGEIHAVRFAASVWGNKDLIKRVGAFDLVAAFSSLDHRKRRVIVRWCREPWLA